MTKEDMNSANPSAHFAKQQYRQQEQLFASCNDAVIGHRGQAVRLVPENWAALSKKALSMGAVILSRKEYP